MNGQHRGQPQGNPGNNEIIYPHHVGYYMKFGLNPQPLVLTDQDIGQHQLDKKLIWEINNTDGGYRFNGSVEDYGIEHDHEPILKNTEVLENYVNQLPPREQTRGKTRIFARGGPLCNFFASNAIRLPISTLDFDYNEEDDILRLTNTATITTVEAVHNGYTMIGEHRLMGDQKEIISFGEDNIYRVMKLTADDYVLFYSKEIDGFDGAEPIEIRGAKETCGLNAMKILYRSAALADVNKIVVMVASDEFLIQKVAIIDDFTRHDNNREPVRAIFFREVNAFFKDYLSILKQFKRGKVTKADGGMIIEPNNVALFDEDRVSVVADKLDSSLWGYLKLNTVGGRFMSPARYKPRQNHKIFLCLTNPQTLEQELQRLGVDCVLGCFVQYRNLQRPRNDCYYTASKFCRRIIYSVDPDLLNPLPLNRAPTCAISPLLYGLPHPTNISLSNDTFWTLSSANNLLFGENRVDIERLLTENFVSWPLPDFPRRIPMTVYCQEPCEDLLQDFFDRNITFVEANSGEGIIFCTTQIVSAEEYRSTVFQVLNLEDDLYEGLRYQSADLYLIQNGDIIHGKWDNKHDLQLLDDFNGLDPIRKSPKTIVLFSADQQERGRVAGILAGRHAIEESYANFVLFEAI